MTEQVAVNGAAAQEDDEEFLIPSLIDIWGAGDAWEIPEGWWEELTYRIQQLARHKHAFVFDNSPIVNLDEDLTPIVKVAVQVFRALIGSTGIYDTTVRNGLLGSPSDIDEGHRRANVSLGTPADHFAPLCHRCQWIQ